MIRPVLNVNLPGIVRAFDQRARSRQSEFATFVAAPEDDEPRSGLAAVVSSLLPITPHAQTWLAEDHWRLLGLAQARIRPGGLAWDLAYLASMSAPTTPVPPSGAAQDGASTPAAPPAQPSPDDTLMALLQYALNSAIGSGAQRFFARIEDERPELEIFGKLGFQRYARESTWALESAASGLRALDDYRAGALLGVERAARERPATNASTRVSPAQQADGVDGAPGERGWLSRLGHTLASPLARPAATITAYADLPLRSWRRHDAWGLLRLYDACTPRRVQVAEGMTADEFTHTRAGGGRTWYVPMLEPTTAAFVHESGPLMGGWLRLRQGRGAQPHRLTLLAHPDEAAVALSLLRFGLRVFAGDAPRPIVCAVRDYETATIDALRAAGFERVGAHALLVRHLAARLAYHTGVPAFDSRMAYGVKGLGTTPTRLSEGGKDTLCQKSSTMISTPSSARSHHALPMP